MQQGAGTTFDQLCTAAMRQSLGLKELLDAQGEAGWGQASLLLAEKLAVSFERLLDPRNEADDFRLQCVSLPLNCKIFCFFATLLDCYH